MKVQVTSVSGSATVRLNNHENLTPTSAKAARDIAFGISANATVTDGHTTYRVTRSGVRKIK